MALISAGKLDEAERLAESALVNQPNDSHLQALLGQIAIARGEYGKALAGFEALLASYPGNVELLNHKAFALMGLERFDDAKQILAELLTLDARAFVANKLLGSVLAQEGQHETAREHFSVALEVQPNDSEINALLAKTLIDTNRSDDAVAYLKQAIKLKPKSPVAFNLMGSAYRYRCRFRTSLSYYRQALKLAPTDSNSLVNYGVGLLEGGQVHEAIVHIRRHLEVEPDCFQARFNLATALLLIGNLADGWEAYEARRHVHKLRDSELPYPDWKGEDIEGKTLLVVAEQGIGDELLAANMYGEIVQKAERCFIECDPRLTGLFERSFPDATFLPRVQGKILSSASQSFDYKSLALSMARWLRSKPEHFPGSVEYLIPDPLRVDFWRWRVAQLGAGLKVGISWRSMLNTGVRRNDYTTLDQWAGIFKLPGCRFINLQYDQCQEELDEASERFGIEIINFRDINLKDDMDDLAALLVSLDVVIAPCNAVAAMAGALNIPVLQFSTNSNWLCHGKDYLPWFPSYQLFFRPWDKDWTEALSGISIEVQRRAQAKDHESSELGTTAESEASVLRQRISRGTLYLQSGQVGKARAICEEILAVRANNEDGLILLGLIEQSAGNIDKAEAVFRRAVEVAPLFAEAFCHLGTLLLTNGRADEAMAEFGYALELRPNYTDALNNLGNAYVAKQDFEQAIQCYQRAIAAFSGYVMARYNYALALEDTGRNVEAIVEYETVVDANKMHAEAWNNLGNLYGKQGRGEAAEGAYRNALEAKPDFVSAHVNLGKLLLRTGGNCDDALKHIETAATARPEDASIANMLGVACASKGDFEKAVKEFEKALSLAPAYLEATRNLGMALQQLGRLEEAREVLVKGLQRQKKETGNA
ncbi:MAG: tetratricopeptide repeat protein [Sterolibacterium sp.]|nr:tetratricopeptide repeat protein [Sterolibacterium sp.]